MILDDIVRDKRQRLAAHKRLISEEAMKEAALLEAGKGETEFPFYKAISKQGLSLIGEFKKASPSLGAIKSTVPFEERIGQYTKTVDAISCLTEEDHFHGCAGDLKAVKAITPLPVLRKDFILEEYQVYEAKVIGADAVLLIAAILEDGTMEGLYRLAYELGLDVLLEVHNEEELSRALSLGARIVGVNNRDLKDFTIDLSTSERLFAKAREKAKKVPPILVSESGVLNTEDVRFLRKCGADALLTGRALMEAKEPAVLAAEWKREG